MHMAGSVATSTLLPSRVVILTLDLINVHLFVKLERRDRASRTGIRVTARSEPPDIDGARAIIAGGHP